MRVLLIEDEPGVARFIKKGLEQEAFAVDVATDGDVGLELALGEPYDLMVVDVMLPGRDGLSVCRAVRQQRIHTPLLLLTARDRVQDKVAGLDSGADDYLTKPFSFEELLARIRALMRRRHAEVIELRLGPLRIDPITRRAFAEERELPLRPKEYAVLEFLVRNRGNLATRTRILENVWGYDFDPLTNTLDVHITSLRGKLKEASARIRIRTVRGVGYRLEEL